MPKKIHSIANKNLLMPEYWEKFYGLLLSGERFGFLSIANISTDAEIFKKKSNARPFCYRIRTLPARLLPRGAIHSEFFMSYLLFKKVGNFTGLTAAEAASLNHIAALRLDDNVGK